MSGAGLTPQLPNSQGSTLADGDVSTSAVTWAEGLDAAYSDKATRDQYRALLRRFVQAGALLTEPMPVAVGCGCFADELALAPCPGHAL